MDICWSCGNGPVITDPSTGFRVCSSCGVEHSTDIFQSQAFDSAGNALSHLVRSVGDYGYREAKLHRANLCMSDVASRLGLPDAGAADAARLASDVTDGELGGGEWFDVLSAACCYVVARRSGSAMSLFEAAAAVGCDVHEMGRMVARVTRHLGLDPLPEFDLGQSLEKAVRTCRCLSGVEEDKAEEMVRQGRFLLQCSVKWFLTTGRQPLPVVAAILAFLSEVNGITATVEEIAREILAGVATSKLRKKELVETLVKAARVLLPWGEDVTTKNLVHNAPLLLRYMEIKSKAGSFDMGTFSIAYQGGYADTERSDSVYFYGSNMDGSQRMSEDELGSLKLSADCLSSAYQKAMEGFNLVKLAEYGKNSERKRRRGGIVIDARMSSEASKKLTLDQILGKDFGYDALPPSFVSGLEARRIRREKIRSAKIRIAEIMKPTETDPVLGMKKDLLRLKKPREKCPKRKRGGGGDIDWDDCIIELLLLHGVKEEEIEQGQYKRLLDLHVFNSLDTKK